MTIHMMTIQRRIKMDIKYHNAEHIKTGNTYQVLELGDVIDCTNERDGTKVKVYYKDGKFFVREAKEFEKKFKEHI